MRKLELISSLPETDARKTPILFIHGAFAGAWCWEEHFLPYFSSHGYRAYALSLRGHGASEGHERLFWTSLREYVADIEQVVAKLGQTPILVGHSMGGMVVQKYLERHSAPAVVLMASAPPQGLLYAAWWLALSNPLLFYEINFIQWLAPYFSTLHTARRAVFSAHMTDHEVAKYCRRMQQESQRAVIDMSGLDLPNFNRVKLPPALVLGAKNDALIPTFLIEATARAFATRAELFPDMAHAMMLETGWQRVAERMVQWLSQACRV